MRILPIMTEDILLEKSMQNLPAEPYKVRVMASGEVQVWSDTDYVIEPGGDSHFEQQEAQWRTSHTISQELLGELSEALRSSGFFELDEQPEQGIKDGTQIVWTACLDGKTHQVTRVVSGDSRLPELELLDEKFTLMTSESTEE